MRITTMHPHISIVRLPLYLAIVWLLVACGAGSVKDEGESEAAPTLMDTNQYLPVQEYDDDNAVYLPYEAKENPYLAQQGRIRKDAVTAFIQARRHFKREQYTAAEEQLKIVLAEDDSLSGPWLMRGEIAEINNDSQLAMEHYHKAIDVNPKNINVYLKLAKLQRKGGKFIEAQNTLAKALAVWPDFPEAHLNIGVIYDVYLNHPIRAQKHIEAYVFLVKEPRREALAWIKEIRSRTQMAESYHPVLAPEKSEAE